MLSNATTTMDSVTHYKDFVDKAAENGMKAVAFTEHGNMFSWIDKKEYAESKGLKYIHGIEAYLTMSLDEKVRDNYHIVMLAKNYDGVEEINRMYSHDKAFNREDGHFHYNPRITMDELEATSDNIIVTSACLGNVLSKDTRKVNGENVCNRENQQRFIKFMVENKHRCFLEIQHHAVEDQKNYNKRLVGLSKKTNIPLIAGTDTHSLNEEHSDGRDVLQKAKGIHFDSEDGWNLNFMSYNELVQEYERQGCVDESVYLEAIQNTNVIADMVEEFEIDKSFKYPKLYDDPSRVLKEKVLKGAKRRGIEEFTDEQKQRINKEIKVMKDMGAIDYMLLEEDVKSFCREEEYWYGYGRGSVTGSYVAYLLGIQDVDSIEHDLIFERFLNKERIGLPDVDTDYTSEDRGKVKDYLYNKEGLYCSEIITFNTISLKGGIRDVGRSLGMSIEETNEISKGVESNEKAMRKDHPKLFKYVDLLNGVIVSIGSHPAATVISPFPIEGVVGTCSLKTNSRPVTIIDMDTIEDCRFVKLDLLVVDNIKLINDTCKMVGIERLNPDNMDVNDEDVWMSMRDDCTAIFQFDGSGSYYMKDLFSDETIAKIKEDDPDFKYIDWLSVGNGIIRPSAESFRDEIMSGAMHDNGHEALNELLKDTRGQLLYQEQIIEFLHQFCGFTLSQADLVRRGLSHKTGTKQYIPKIKEGFIETMGEKYDTCEEEAEKLIDQFLVVIENASSYGFSLNHSLAYSFIGYANGYLRYHYPLQFLTSCFNTFGDNNDKIGGIMNYMNTKTDIKLRNIEFGFSRADYSFNSETNSIYQGIANIKYLNKQISEELFEMSQKKKYKTFLEVLHSITKETSLNTRQLKILTSLNFFEEFGTNKKLLNFTEYFSIINSRKQFSKKAIHENKFSVDEDTKEKIHLELQPYEKYFIDNSRQTDKTYMDLDTDKILEGIWNDLDDERLSLQDQLVVESDSLGYLEFTTPSSSNDLWFVSAYKTYQNKRKPYVTLYNVSDGSYFRTKVDKPSEFAKDPFRMHSVIRVNNWIVKPRFRRLGDGKYEELDETQELLERWEVMQK